MQAPERHSTRSAEVTKAEAAARLPLMHALTLSAGEGGGGRRAARARGQRGRDRGGHGRGRGGAPAGVAAEPGAGAGQGPSTWRAHAPDLAGMPPWRPAHTPDVGGKLSGQLHQHHLPKQALRRQCAPSMASSLWDLHGLVRSLSQYVSACMGFAALCSPAPWTIRAGAKEPDSAFHAEHHTYVKCITCCTARRVQLRPP